MDESERNFDPKLFRPEHLERFRKNAHLTKAKAAKEAGVDASTWGRYEKGSSHPGNMDTILRLSVAIGVSVDELLDNTDEQEFIHLMNEAYGWPSQQMDFMFKLSSSELDLLRGWAQNRRDYLAGVGPKRLAPFFILEGVVGFLPLWSGPCNGKSLDIISQIPGNGRKDAEVLLRTCLSLPCPIEDIKCLVRDYSLPRLEGVRANFVQMWDAQAPVDIRDKQPRFSIRASSTDLPQTTVVCGPRAVIIPGSGELERLDRTPVLVTSTTGSLGLIEIYENLWNSARVVE